MILASAWPNISLHLSNGNRGSSGLASARELEQKGPILSPSKYIMNGLATEKKEYSSLSQESILDNLARFEANLTIKHVSDGKSLFIFSLLKMKENCSLFRPRFIHWVADLIFRSQPIPALANPWHDTQYVETRFGSMLKTLQKLQMLPPSMSMSMSDVHWQLMSLPIRLAKESKNKLKSYSLRLF